MLKFYYHPLSPVARRVWIALLEKKISFDPVLVDLRGQQFKEDFVSINPFHHVPVVVHEDVCLIESMAILDYLESRFAKNPLSPSSPGAAAQMKMVQMVVTNELLPKLVAVANAEHQPVTEAVNQHLATCFQFLEQQLGNQAYFGGDRINLADIVAGSTVPLFYRLGVSLQPYLLLQRWHALIIQRSAWQQTNPSDEACRQWQRWIQLQVKKRQRHQNRSALA